MKRSIKPPVLFLLSAMAVLAILIVVEAPQARSIAPLNGVKFDTASSIKDNLKALVGKDVVIHLRSGKSFQGYVKGIGDHMIHIEKLSGRDFYDVLIRVEDISGIETQFREMK